MPAFCPPQPTSYSSSLTSSSCSLEAAKPKIMTHIHYKYYQQSRKASIPSPKPTHPSPSIEEQTLNTLTCKLIKQNPNALKKNKRFNF